jgi:hypothetical protein
MKRIFWLAILVGSYIWVLTSGHDEYFLEKGKLVFSSCKAWLEQAETDLQIPKKSKERKKIRRWD